MIVLLFLTPISSFTYSIQVENNYNTEKSLQSHVIKNVPYVGWETDFDCELVSFATLYLYLGINYTYHDLFYLCGAGYSHASRPKANGPRVWPPTPPFKSYIDPGAIVCFWKQDISFLCDIFGLNYSIKYNYSKKINYSEGWEEYWERVKNYIKNDQPVWTTVDVIALPWWREHFPWAKKMYEKNGLPGIGGHVIVIVGFNESNKTVCYNDMVNSDSPGYIGEPNINCHYVWMNISDFKNATSLGGWAYYWDDMPYLTLVLENSCIDPFDKQQALKEVHKRNIGKMKGWNNSVYDESYQRMYGAFGIEALKRFINDLRTESMIPRLLFWRFFNMMNQFIGSDYSFSPFKHINTSIQWIIKEKQLTSEVLLKYANQYPDQYFFTYDGYLLENETEKWIEFKNKLIMLIESFNQEDLFIEINELSEIIQEMSDIVTDIIEIEKRILAKSNV